MSNFSDFYARRFASNFADSRSRAFGLSIRKKESLVRNENLRMASISIVKRLTIGPPGTPLTYTWYTTSYKVVSADRCYLLGCLRGGWWVGTFFSSFMTPSASL